MDIATRAAGLTGFLGPLIPYLVKGNENAPEMLGQDAWEKATALWGMLRGQIGEDSAAVREMAEAPQDEDAQAALRVALKRALKADPALAEALALLFDQAATPAAQTVGVQGNENAVAQGEGAVAAVQRSVAVGGSVSGSVIVTGDHGSVKR